MYLERVIIKGYGSIENLDLIPQFNYNGSPKPIVIVGKNGSGKTLLLSQLVDSLIELKRLKYNSMPEVKEDNYFKSGKKSYINIDANDSLVELTFKENDKKFTYIDFMSKNIHESAILHANYVHYSSIASNARYQENGFYRSISGSKVENELDNNIVSYFPVHRYHVPAWYNKENKQIGFQFSESNIGFNNNSLVKENVINEVEGWLLDVLLDMYLYERESRNVVIYEGNNFRQGTEEVMLDGKNSILRNLINRILTIIYQVKYENIESARIGVSQKSARRISIVLKEHGKEEREIAPSFSHLSSGEAMLLSLFASILKSYDDLSELQNIHHLQDVKGIVIIDEIDLNLHIEFARIIIPELINLFPNVQFIITTHSPFMLLGMEEQFKDKWQLINLPNGEEISVDDFSEVKVAYEIFVEGHQGLKDVHRQLVDRIKMETKTLIITEGKTDWKHLKNAYHKLKIEPEFNSLDLEFLEFDETMLKMSDSQLNTLLKELAKVSRNKKIIGIFDSDEANGKKYAKERRIEFGNNVFAFSIPKPDFRDEFEGISIELLYRDNDIKTEDENGRRLYLTTEFNTVSGRHLEDKMLTYSDKVSKLKTPKIIDCDVYNADDINIALSKNQFANYILNQHDNFNNFDLNGFKEVFRILKEIEEL